MSAAQTPVFEARIVPYRSLTRRGITLLVMLFSVLTASVALRFWLWGAWPVVAFSLVEIPLILVLLAINIRRARASELIMLTESEIQVIRTDASGHRKSVSLPSAWLRIDLETGRGLSRLVLTSRGHGCEVGGFLHEPERLSLFEALRTALHRVQHPMFDNPQLRDV